jgi:hypothetical protein
MQGHTEAETDRAIEQGGPGTAFSLALAELHRHWDCHPGLRPEPGNEPVISLHLPKGISEQDGIAAVRDFAAWLGVGVAQVCGTHIAKAHFGPAGHGVFLERHYTPDHEAAYALRLEAGLEAA